MSAHALTYQDAAAGVTHVIVEPDAVDHVPPHLLPSSGAQRSGKQPPPALVTAEWLAACLAQHGRASEVPFTVVAGNPRGDHPNSLAPCCAPQCAAITNGTA